MSAGDPRVGTGVDVDRLEPGRACWVAGLHWPDEPAGCTGHAHTGTRRPRALADPTYTALT